MSNRAAQVYGYAVCFITVVTMLIAIKQVVDAAFDLSNPIRAESGGYGRQGRTITNFELYKADAKNQRGARGAPVPVASGPDKPQIEPAGATAAADTLSDVEMRRMYEAERAEAIDNVHFRATRSLVGNLLLIVVAGVLFGVHWRWLRRRDDALASA